jgi:hypothetical protein
MAKYGKKAQNKRSERIIQSIALAKVIISAGPERFHIGKNLLAAFRASALTGLTYALFNLLDY